MDDEGTFTDYASVRDLLLDAQNRRGFLTYEQKAALRSTQNGLQVATETVTRQTLRSSMTFSMQSWRLNFSKNTQTWQPKLAELMPMHEDDVRAVIASRRISIDGGDVSAVLDIVRQHVGVE